MTKPVIPPEVLAQHLGIFGKTGRGKTTTAKDCVEQVYDEDFRVCILDPIKSDWWGLTSSADGKRAGLPFYILGGPHAHLPLASNSGKAIADLVARGQLRHTIIDMAEFEPGGQLRWFVDFAPRLLQKMKGVLYLVIEEAHLFAPKERAGMGHENMAIHWAKMLATAGRTKGIRLIVLSQRTQSLHNAVIGSCDSMIVHGFTAPADMEPLIKWIKANTKDKDLVATIEGSLSNLKTGTGWLCSSEAGIFALREFPRSRTYDNTATPEDDSELAAVKMAPVDLEALRGILGKAAADAEANDPALLKKRIAELEADAARKPKGASLPEQIAARQNARDEGIELGRQEGFRKGYVEALDAARKIVSDVDHPAIDSVVAAMSSAHNDLQARLGALLAALPKAPAVRVMTPYTHQEVRGPQTGNALMNKRQREQAFSQMADAINRAAAGDGVSLNNVSHPYGGLKGKILGALLWLEDRGMTPAPRMTVAALAGAKATGGYFRNTLGAMGAEQLILSASPGTIEITDDGRRVAPSPPAYESLQDAWRAILSGLERQILEALIEAHPQPLSREEIAQRTGKTANAGYFRNILGRLGTMGAIVSSRGSVSLSKYVMP